MSIYGSICRELKKFGENLTVTTEKGSFSVKGVLQPLLYKNKLYLGGKQLPQGFFDGGHYLLICPPEVKLPTLGTALAETKDRKFNLIRSETVTSADKALYIWAVLAPCSEAIREDIYENTECC